MDTITRVYVEYFNHHHLVRHTLRPKGKRTICGNKVSKMLVARNEDLVRAATYRTRTLLATCWECDNGIEVAA